MLASTTRAETFPGLGTAAGAAGRLGQVARQSRCSQERGILPPNGAPQRERWPGRVSQPWVHSKVPGMDAGLVWCGSGLRPGGFCNPTCRPCLLGGLVCGWEIWWHRLHEWHQHHEGFSAQRFPFSLLSRPGDLHNGAGLIPKASSNSFQYCSVSKIPLAVCAVRPGARRAGQAAEHPRTIPSTPTLWLPKPFPEQPPPAYSHTPVGNYPQGSFINPDVSFHCWCPGEGRARTPRFSSTRLPFISGAD